MAIPRRQEIVDLVETLPVAKQRWQAYNDGPRVMLTIAAGCVQVSHRKPGTLDRLADRAKQRRAREADEVAREVAERLNGRMFFTEAHEAAERRRLITEAYTPRPGGGNTTVITSWSKRSRNRMLRTMFMLDFNPLFDDGLAPAMVTLTLPGRWEQLAPTPRAFKAMIDDLRRRYTRAWGGTMTGVWKMEFQRRGAPHLHILMTPPEGTASRGLGVGERFLPWMSREWASVVGETDPVERAKHVARGVDLEFVDEAYRDPRRIAFYFAKHGLFSAKEYQNQLPDLWLEAIAAGEHSASFWGHWGLEKAAATVELSYVRPAVELFLDETGAARPLTFVAVLADVIRHYRTTGEPVPADDVLRALARERVRLSWVDLVRPDDGSETDASWSRALHRDAERFVRPPSDAVLVERHLRKLARSLACTRHHGQIVLERGDDGRLTGRTVKKVRKVRYRVTLPLVDGVPVDPRTGEVVEAGCRTVRKSVVGYYAGGSGFLSVNDGRISGASVMRLLVRQGWYDLAA